MTALTRYQRIEATGLWRARPEDQRREVVVSLGEATLVITDLNDRALTHWSLAAVLRDNPGERPAIFYPDGDPGETLELAESEGDMIDAIETLRKAIDRARPKPGRLRSVGILVSVVAVVLLGIFWVPGALKQQALTVVPAIKRQEIGRSMLRRAERVSGRACTLSDARGPLARLAARTGVREIAVMPGGVREALALPGGLVILNRSLIEDHEDPAVAAGHILAERARAGRRDPLDALLSYAGPMASFRLLTTGEITNETLTEYTEYALTRPRPDLPEEVLLAAFTEARVPSTPFAYAVDATGESVLSLIEADPMTGLEAPAVMTDRDWVMLQNICLAD
ncbi:hypothetical protein [Marinibacterium profundimaris]|uniref:Peptidase M48 domain-containing protein n=1 Tax=Marinibacterium profundimaris TaxID=1679460 RepID=A0A225NI60_9RHOB|nr:hypothetical protein [Marinibacterium profundimaris]OWU70424.1 hypothetical protein ATO3_20835 [Marinibacterium profundimaris]